MINATESRKRQEALADAVRSLLDRLYQFTFPSELDRCDDAEVERIARDIGVAKSELRALAKAPAGPPVLLHLRLAALHLDPNDTDRIPPSVLRDLQTHCSMCAGKKRCAAELASAGLDSTWQDYCPNAYTLRALVADASPSDNFEDLMIYLNTVGGDKHVGPGRAKETGRLCLH